MLKFLVLFLSVCFLSACADKVEEVVVEQVEEEAALVIVDGEGENAGAVPAGPDAAADAGAVPVE
jgi:hypothetical protein